MSKFSWSEIPRNALIVGGLALLVVAGLVVKMGLDLRALQAAGDTGAPASEVSETTDASDTSAFILSGFRSANFGDDEAAVRKAIEKDFNVPGDKITVGESTLEKTKLLAVRVKDVVPDSGIAEVVYILGYKSQKLIQVNLVWGTNLSPEITPQQFGAVATLLGQYFAELGFDPKKVTVNQKLQNGAVRVFNGRDAGGRMVTLLFQEGEVKAEKPADKVADKSKAKDDVAPVTRKVAGLRLSYVANPVEPDIFKIEKGKF
ncbi:MAG: hypothetical protein Q7T44_03400 [Parvibaculum sp.]|nr:hypothetical protein [Parvibaculum sp.]